MAGMELLDIESMPRGGPNASRLDRWLQTDRMEYLDRDDVPNRKRNVIRSLDRVGRIYGFHRAAARIALDEVADVLKPKILELGAGHGAMSRTVLGMHLTAQLTVTDIEPASVTAIAEGDLGRHPRTIVREMDATNIDAPDKSYDLAVFVLSFHHLPPTLAYRVFAEGTRAANKLLIIDLPRPSPAIHLLRLAPVLPLTVFPLMHDGFISSLRSYSPSALQALARHADPEIDIQLRRAPLSPLMPRAQVAVAQRLP